MGYDAGLADALFDSFDVDASGEIEYSEINKALRRGADVSLDPSLQAGGAGKIETDMSAPTRKPRLCV